MRKPKSLLPGAVLITIDHNGEIENATAVGTSAELTSRQCVDLIRAIAVHHDTLENDGD